MKGPQIDIYKSLRTNRLITLSVVIVTAIILVVTIQGSYSYSREMLGYTLNHVLAMNTEGEVVPQHLIKRNEQIKIEVSDHLEKWFTRFYDFNFNTVDKKPATAQWLIAKKEYDQLKDQYKGWWTEVRKMKYSQTAVLEPDSIQVTGNEEPYEFRASAIIRVSNGYSENAFRLKTSGQIIFVQADYPRNPHGFFILNYKEISNIKIQ